MTTRPNPSRHRPPLLVSFSGIDGAGKTTQIEMLAAWLKQLGLSVHVIRFWEDVAAVRRMRETLGHALFRGEKGVGSPDKPVRRRDKDVRSWYALPLRMALCLLDTLCLAAVLRRIKRHSDADIAVFDRYVYDQYANLDSRYGPVLGYLRFLVKRAPQPDVAYLLDAHPELARARKPEYPLTFLWVNRDCYLRVCALAGMTLIPPGSIEDTALAIQRELAAKLSSVCPAADQILTSRSG